MYENFNRRSDVMANHMVVNCFLHAGVLCCALRDKSRTACRARGIIKCINNLVIVANYVNMMF